MEFQRRRSLYVDPYRLECALEVSTQVRPGGWGRALLVLRTVFSVVISAGIILILVTWARSPVLALLCGLVTVGQLLYGIGTLPPGSAIVSCDRAIVQRELGLNDDDMDLVMQAYALVMADYKKSRSPRYWAQPIARSMQRVLMSGAHYSEHPLGGS